MQRLLPVLLTLLCALARGSDAPAAKSWPLWDGQESVEQYAQRANLPPTKMLDLGNGVTLELVLIPGGEFVMGTPEPDPVDEDGFRRKILTGQTLLSASGGVLLVLVGAVVVQAIRRRRRPQYSLARFLAMVVSAGAGVLSGAHWWQSAQLFEKAKAEYQAALARYKDASDWEKPAHKVTLTTPFYIGKFEVTQEQYQQVMGTNPSSANKGKNNPATMLSWDDAQEFIKKVSQSTAQPLRLPTEAEWEYACRAGTKTVYYTGDAEADLDRAGWYSGNSKGTTHPVGGKGANAWGVDDMHGNVWEWCQDWYETYKPEASVDPQGPPEGKYRVLRGGSWNSFPEGCRSANRHGFRPDLRDHYLGIRVVVSVCRTP